MWRASSTTLSTIRSQARGYVILEGQRRNISKEPTKVHGKLLRKESEEALLNPLKEEVNAESHEREPMVANPLAGVEKRRGT